MHETRLYGPIGGFGISAEEFLAGLPADANEITVRIHSPGGSVGEGLAIYHGLRDHPAHVVTIVDGYAASSASFVMLAGDEIRVHRNSMIFVHNPWTSMTGNAKDLRKAADDLDVHADAIMDIYRTRTGVDAETIQEMVDDEVFFRGTDAVEMGWATVLVDDPETEAQIAAALSQEELIGELIMSRQKTRKEIEEELGRVNSQLETAAQEHEQVRTELENVNAGLAETVESLRGELEAVKTEFSTALQEKDERIAALQFDLETAQQAAGETDGLRAEIENLKHALANPAIADATMIPQEIDTAAADAEADAAEKAADQIEDEREPETPAEIWESMPPGREREAYWSQHKRQILKEMETR